MRTGRPGVLEHGRSLTAGLSARAGPLGAFQKVLRPAWGSMIMGWDGGPRDRHVAGTPTQDRQGDWQGAGGSARARAWGPDPPRGAWAAGRRPCRASGAQAGRGPWKQGKDPLTRRVVPSGWHPCPPRSSEAVTAPPPPPAVWTGAQAPRGKLATRQGGPGMRREKGP